VFSTAEVDHYWTVFADTAPNERKGNGALYAALEAPLSRFSDDLDDDTRERFRSDLDAYIRGYSFLSQIATWTDEELEKLYVFTKSLKAVLPRRENDGAMDLGSEIELTHLRIEKQGEFDATLAGETGGEVPLAVYTGGGSTGSGDPETERLSAIVNRLNEKHGLNLSLTDALLFEQFKDDWTADPEIQAAARANDLGNFMIVFTKKFMNVVLSRMDTNADIFKAILDDDAFAKDLQTSYGRDVYQELTDGSDQ
jgi:type I restriction enzyme R subunit